MPLQNRVDPFGDIHAAPGRGMLTGNRGVLHDPATKTLLSRRWTTKAWIVCGLTHPLGLRREVMGRNAPSGGAGWTELFFLDEVTALAAGHRPCFYCRREDARAFARCFASARGLAKVAAPEMDAVLHAQRRASGAGLLPAADISSLPDGAMVTAGGKCFARFGDRLLQWTFQGYRPAASEPRDARLLTPPATLAVLAAGYRPIRHPSAT